MQDAWTGRAHTFGNNVDTDAIIPGKYTKTLDFEAMKDHTFEPVTADFSKRCKPGDFVVAGHHFGIGSSREQAPLVLKLCGIRCIAAKGFSRIFYRNAINLGIALVECDTDTIRDGDRLAYDLRTGVLTSHTTGERFEGKPLPERLQRVLQCGGIVNYLNALRETGADITLD